MEELGRLYEQLKAQYDADELTIDQFRTQMLRSRLQDSQGRYWMIDPQTGNWIVNAGGAWIEGTPPVELSGEQEAEEAADWMQELRSASAGAGDEGAYAEEASPPPMFETSTPPPPPVAPARAKAPTQRTMILILVALFVIMILVFCALGAVLTNGYGVVDLGLW
jgi:hypothetical protein